MPSALRELRIGTIVDGKYRVAAILGRGAMGVVAECQHLELRERVALKFLLTAGDVGSEDFRARFLREAQVSARLKNEHITRVVDVGVWLDSVPYMVMEHLDGLDLRAAIRAAGRLSPARAVDYATQVCEGIAEAHAFGVIHRDLKPSNLFVTTRSDGSDLIKIIDFGISKRHGHEVDPGEATATGVILGSPKYMSPEQMFAASTVDARADVWSIGAIIYEMLTGHPPFESLTFPQLCEQLLTDRPPQSICAQARDVSPLLERTVFRCLERSVDKRIQSVAELAGALLDAVSAPRSAHVRARIEAILSPRRSRDWLVPPERVSGRFTTETCDAVPAAAPVAPISSRAPSDPMASGALRPVLLESQSAKRGLRTAMGAGLLFAAAMAMASLGSDRRSSKAAPLAEPAQKGSFAAGTVPPTTPIQPPRTSGSGAPAEPRAAATVLTASTVDFDSKSPPHPSPSLVRAVGQPGGGAAPATAPITPAALGTTATHSGNARCDPPFVLSTDGVRSYKPECF